MNNNRCVICGRIIPEGMQVCANCQSGNKSNNMFDLLSLVSLFVGLQNLQENREQTAYNDVQQANNEQAKFLLTEIEKRFNEQNKMLKRIIELLEKLCQVKTNYEFYKPYHLK